MRKLNILLVDDNAQFLQAARSLIARLPCVMRIECANSGAEALAQIDSCKPELVLTDIVMPDMSGFELIRQLCARDAPPQVMALSLHEGPEYRAAALRSGAQELVSKHEFAVLVPALVAAVAQVAGAS
jgi:DNA-binding NarL/FixJ family response regulator